MRPVQFPHLANKKGRIRKIRLSTGAGHLQKIWVQGNGMVIGGVVLVGQVFYKVSPQQL